MNLTSSIPPIVHIATDEKFINAAQEIYEIAFPGQNHFIILHRLQNNLKYIDSNYNFTLVNLSDGYLDTLLNKIKDAKIVVFHGMIFEQAKIALSINKSGKIFVWNVFGSEVYTNPYLFGKEIYGKETFRKFVFSISDILKDYFRPHFYTYIKKCEDPNLQKIRALRSMDYVSTIIDEEYDLYKKLGIVQRDSKLLNFTYYPLDIVIDKNMGTTTGCNILIGNSASYTNNHLEAFKLLKKMDLEERQIITPLSYGKNEYAKEIINLGKTTFGNQFKPLTKFLEIQQYHRVIQSCEIVIMNHYRQQAVGNIFNMLYMGSKIYLSEKNTIFHFLKRLKCHVYSIEKDLEGENLTNLKFMPLTFQQKEENKEIIMSSISLSRISSELREKLGWQLL